MLLCLAYEYAEKPGHADGKGERNMMQQHDGIQEASDDSLAKRPVKFIKNPLPGPKPHVKKEMNYDYEVPPDKMFFDIDKPSRNYYDLP